MTQEAVGRMFQPFEQADSSVQRTHGGTGLGLSISKALVELCGGHIYARSQLGTLPHTTTDARDPSGRCWLDVWVHMVCEARDIRPHRRPLKRAKEALGQVAANVDRCA